MASAASLPSPVDFDDFADEAADEALYESTYVISSHSDYAEYYDRIDPADPFSLSEEQTFFLVDEHFQYCHGPSSKKQPPTTWTFDEEGQSPKVTFNEASSDLWRGAQVELHAIRDNIVKKAGLPSLNEYDPIRHSVGLFFGEGTSIGDLLKSSLAISRKKMLQFLATYAFQKQHGKSVTSMYAANSGLDLAGLMSEEEYLACWKIIDTDGNSPCPQRRGPVPLWQRFESRMNETFVDLYVCFQGQLVLALDDDKRNAELKADRDQQALKSAVHDAKKRAGVVGHTCVSIHSGLTFSVQWERLGDTPHICYMRCVDCIFGPDKRLERVTFGSDRGYWNRPLLEELIGRGADVEGTWKRCGFIPFTYEQPESTVGNRRLMSTEGPATLHRATTTIDGKTFAACYSTTGTGKGVLTGSTIHTDQHM